MKCLIFFFALICCSECYSQNNPTPIKKGIYSGGICFDDAICGDWILKPDSSFVFIEFDKSCIINAAMGKITAVSDSFITMQFGKILPVLSNIKIECFSETKQSFDSIYFYGQLKNTLNEPIPYATIVYGKKWSTISDSKGNFTGVFSLNGDLAQIEVIDKSRGFSPIVVQLNPNSNYHRLMITIPIVDSNSCISAESLIEENSKYTFRIFTDRPKKSSSIALTYVSGDEKLITNKLLEAKNKQPFLSSSINALISYISK